MSPRTSTAVIIGAGQAGLAMSHCLTERSIDHVILERGRVGERWRSERWDSLRLLTPNWQTRLPGWTYAGDDPTGFMSMPEVTEFLTGYADSFDAPIQQHTTVVALERSGPCFRVTTTDGSWTTSNVVIATGACDVAHIPAVAEQLPAAVRQITPSTYRRPDQLPEGGVLVVGAGASGVQLADELRRSGRDVVLAAGNHTFLPRRYRGLDIHWWLDQIGALDAAADHVDLARARREPSLQLVGDASGRSVGLHELQRLGVRLAGRLLRCDGHHLDFADDLHASCAAAYARQERVLDRIDDFIGTVGLEREVDAPDRPPPVRPAENLRELDLRHCGIQSIVWATGYRREYPWLQIPVLDAEGELRHDGGITPVPGLYAIGLPFLRTRKSTFLDGVGPDAQALAEHLAQRVRCELHPTNQGA